MSASDELGGGTDEMNPFSFKEFIRNKNQSSSIMGCEEGKKSGLFQKVFQLWHIQIHSDFVLSDDLLQIIILCYC